MLDALIGGGLGIIGGIINQNAANKRYKSMMRHLREVEAWGRNDRAQAIGTIQGAKQQYESDPRRGQQKMEWQKLLDNPSAMTPELQSQLKATALSSSARNTAESSRRLASSAQAHGLGNSPYAQALQGDLYSRANRDALDTSTQIDTEAAQMRLDDKKKVLSGYGSYLDQDSEREYGYARDISSLLGNTQYGNSLALA